MQNEKILTPNLLAFRKFKRNKLAVAGVFLLSAMGLFAFLGPFFSPYGEYAIFFSQNGREISAENGDDIAAKDVEILRRAPPSAAHILGTDNDGRDILTRLMFGGRISLVIGFGVVAVEMALGILMGGIAGFYGGAIDGAIMRLADAFNCIPSLPVMLIGSSAMITLQVPQRHRIYYAMLFIGFLGWAGVARLVRGQILSLREQEFMIAAEASGLSPMRRIFCHLIPNVMPLLIVSATLSLGNAILLESSLSFLGFGLPFPYASWGNMVNAVCDPVVLRGFWNIWIPPGLCILASVMSFNFVGDGLRDALDPKAA